MSGPRPLAESCPYVVRFAGYEHLPRFICMDFQELADSILRLESAGLITKAGRVELGNKLDLRIFKAIQLIRVRRSKP